MSIMVTRPADTAFAVTPNNSTDLATPTRGVYVGVSGDLKVDLVGGSTEITFVGLASGVIHPIQARRIYATGTSATNIVGIS
jgi:hypothetical protein